MPTKRRGLRREERAEDLVRAEQLRASGVEIEIPQGPTNRNPGLEIVVADPMACTLYEFSSGVIGYAPRVRLIPRTGMTIEDCDISTKWDDQIVLESFHCKPCKLGNVLYGRGEILNDRIEHGLRLRRGDLIEGHVLATGLLPTPIEYHDSPVRFEITFFDQFGDDYRANGMLSVLWQPPDPARKRKGGGLYEGNGEPPALSIEEESRLRYLAVVAQQKLEQQQKLRR